MCGFGNRWTVGDVSERYVEALLLQIWRDEAVA